MRGPSALLPPAGEPLLRRAWRHRALLAGDEEDLARALARWLGAARVELVASGREALRRVLVARAERSGRGEVVVPAYTCFSVPAAAVAAGLRVRLVDVTPEGVIDPDALGRLPLERAAALVVSNLFGLAEPIEAVRSAAHPCRVAVVDDAAQSLGARDASGLVGTRGDVGVLSFARGKPLPALGGGAIVGSDAAPPPERAAPRPGAPTLALLRAAAHDAALHPRVFPHVARLPGLHVGESRFDPEFARGAAPRAAVALAAALVPELSAMAEARARRAEAIAEQIAAETAFSPLRARPGTRGVYPRLAVLAPDAGLRDAAVAALRAAGIGAARLYPVALDELAALAPHRRETRTCPGARDLAARLLTLPVPREEPEVGGRVLRILAALRPPRPQPARDLQAGWPAGAASGNRTCMGGGDAARRGPAFRRGT